MPNQHHFGYYKNLRRKREQVEIMETNFRLGLESTSHSGIVDNELAHGSQKFCELLSQGKLVLTGYPYPVTLPPEVITQVNQWSNMCVPCNIENEETQMKTQVFCETKKPR
jgi:hypothetical protein